MRERPGVSAFALEDGLGYHAYSTDARGLDGLWGMYQWLDRAPQGLQRACGGAATTNRQALSKLGRRPMEEALIVRRETHIPAPPAAVFALLTDPEKIMRWMGTEAEVEPQSGGLYLVNVTGARYARGSFREVVPVHRLAYSFGWDGSEVVPPGSSLVEIDLAEQPPDGTLLRLTHSGLPNAEQCAGHAEGWAHYLGRLAEVAAGHDPGPDPWHGRIG
jgi:uncharacterized protein YndB with AHSA1/START domain